MDLLASKLHPPTIRQGTVRRGPLIERLAGHAARPIVAVIAPAGYGKTTLLAQWLDHADQAVAWVSLDEQDNDPKVLLAYIARALNAVQPMDQRVFDVLASAASSVAGSVVPRLSRAFASMTVPVVLVLDDVHHVRGTECRAALSVLADHMPAGSRLVFAGRDEPPLRIARLRAERRILEIGPGDLALTRGEAASLLRAADVMLGEDDVAELHRRSEGWAVGLYLAALYLREGGSLASADVAFDGGDQFVSEYIRSELLDRIPPRQRRFVTRIAVLDRMSGPLCETVLELPGAAAMLAELARSNLLLVPLDRRGQWYRYHHLFRDMLLAELERLEPGVMPVLRRRAALWCLRNGRPAEALEYAMAAGDVDTAARLVEQLVVPAYRQGQVTTLHRWLRWLDDRGGIGKYLMVAVMAASLSAALGRPVEAERFADMADRCQQQPAGRTGDAATQAYAAMLRAMLCRQGAEQMRADADEAVRRCAAAGIVSPTPARYAGIARLLCGDLDGADASFQAAASTAEDTGAHEELAVALCERALLAMGRGAWEQADGLTAQTEKVLRQAGIEGSYATPLACAAQARMALHRGDVPEARRLLVSAQRVRPLLSYAMPHLAVQARLELARVHLALSDTAGARTLLREVDEMLKRRPALGTLAGQAQELRARLAMETRPGSAGPSALTTAELRLLPLLSTHLSLPEIAAELSLSPHTVKSQAYSIYRKLGASSRSEAVNRSRDLTLLEG